MVAVPTGTVTFLFTDIEGSTKLWERHTGTMRTALARHDEILQEAIEGHGGFVFKTVGDAFCAAFATALDALESALAAQRALLSERWGEEIDALRARMALHTGTADERNGDYFGPCGQPGGEAALGWSRRTGAAVFGHPGAGTRPATDGGVVERPGGETPQRPFQTGEGLPACGSRPAARLPSAENFGELSQQPASAAHDAHRARARGGGGVRATPQPRGEAFDPHRAGGYGEDSGGAAGCRRAVGGVRGRGFLRRARRHRRARAGGPYRRKGYRADRERRPAARGTPQGLPARQADAAGAGQLRAGPGVGAAPGRVALGSSQPEDPGHKPHSAEALRRARVPRSASLVARPRVLTARGAPHPVWSGQAIRREGQGCQARLLPDGGERPGSSGDLREAGRVASGNRTRCGPHKVAPSPGDARSIGRPFEAPHRRSAKPAPEAKDPQERNRMELRAARRGREDTLLAIGGILWRVHSGGHGGHMRRRERAAHGHPRGHLLAHGQEPAEAGRGSGG